MGETVILQRIAGIRAYLGNVCIETAWLVAPNEDFGSRNSRQLPAFRRI